MGLTGADTGLEGRGWGPLEKSPLEGLPELKGLSAFREEFFSELSTSPSRSGMAKELRSFLWHLSRVAGVTQQRLTGLAFSFRF